MSDIPDIKKFVYLERKFLFPNPPLKHMGETKEKCAILGNVQRAVGCILGKVAEIDVENKSGKLEVGTLHYDFVFVGKLLDGPTSPGPGQESRFSFWPTLDKEPGPRVRKTPKLKSFKVLRFYKNLADNSTNGKIGYVEIIGKLTRLFSDGFLVLIESKKGIFYVPVMGDYPYPDEIGSWIYLTAKWDKGVMALDETLPLAFVPDDIVRSELRKERGQTKPKFNKKFNPKFKPPQGKRPAFPKRNLFEGAFEVAIANIEIPQAMLKDLSRSYPLIKNTMQKTGRVPSPVKLVKKGEHYRLVDGITRIKIAKELGWNKIMGKELQGDE